MSLSKFALREALHHFDNATVQRGRNYFIQDRVLDIIQETHSLFSASVSGTHVYDQKIIIDEDNSMRGACNCPVGLNCKHVVAAIYAYLDSDIPSFPKKQSNTILKTASEQWLSKLKDANETKPSEKYDYSDGKDFLIYKLFDDKTHDGSHLEFYRTKMLKRGGLSKGHLVSRENMFYQYNWKGYVNEEDKLIIRSLENLGDTSNKYADTILFSGNYGVDVLKQLLETQRCFYKNQTVPLRWSDTSKTLHFTWEEKDSHTSIISNLQHDEHLILNTLPLLCINHTEHTVYEMINTYNAKTLELLFDAPHIPKEELTKVSTNFLETLPHLPLPNNANIKELSISPIPSLLLVNDIHNGINTHCMKLKYLYDTYSVQCHPKRSYSVLTDEGNSVKIIRDLDKESFYATVIEDAGFTYENSEDAYLSYNNPTRQSSIERWRVFINDTMPKLQQEGWQIEIDDNFNYEFEDVNVVNVESSTNNNWFELSFTVDLAGRTLALLPIVTSLLAEYDSVDDLPSKLNLEFEEGKYLHINTEEIRPILQTIFELFDKQEGDKLKVNAYDAHLLEIDESHSLVWKGSQELKTLSKKLKNFEGITEVTPSPNLQATLRDYQKFGLNWLNFLHEFKFSGILADDMGLGKTVQTLAFLQYLKEQGKLTKPSLIIMPTSLIGNWKNEISKFTPNLSYLELYGIDRADKFDTIKKHDIILTTYQLAQRDVDKYANINFDYIILDEAQKIKNPKTKMAIAIKTFQAEHKLALSGTPIENHLGELWSIFDFLMGGFLDTLKTFKSFYQIPIEEEHNVTRQKLLNKKIAPFILRRTKEEVVKELPSKTVIVKKALLGNKQAKLYENIRITMEEKVRDTIKDKGLSRSHITILDALLKLRQVCCHPQLLKLEAAKKVHDSAKLDLFLELIDELMLENRKVLVFSQFTSMLSILEDEIKKRKITYTKLTGATRKREEVIENFTKGDASIFLISLKAGGIGLNLVEADTVIHYDPWWNPAVENQATDRAYRIGQDKPVFVYKLIIENSIEEKILQLQEKKKSLQDGIYKNEHKDEKDIFKGEELINLLKL